MMKDSTLSWAEATLLAGTQKVREESERKRAREPEQERDVCYFISVGKRVLVWCWLSSHTPHWPHVGLFRYPTEMAICLWPITTKTLVVQGQETICCIREGKLSAGPMKCHFDFQVFKCCQWLKPINLFDPPKTSVAKSLVISKHLVRFLVSTLESSAWLLFVALFETGWHFSFLFI